MIIFLILALTFLHEIEANNFLVEIDESAEDISYEIATEKRIEKNIGIGDDYGIKQTWAVI